jgi:dipeptide transport system permease protein
MLRFLLSRILLIDLHRHLNRVVFPIASSGRPRAARGERSLTPERHADLLKQFGFDRPIWEQYFSYLWNLLQGDLGISLKTKIPVTQEFLTLFPATIELSLAAVIFAIVFGIPAGVIAAVRRGIFDHTMGTALIGFHVIFWWACCSSSCSR